MLHTCSLITSKHGGNLILCMIIELHCNRFKCVHRPLGCCQTNPAVACVHGICICTYSHSFVFFCCVQLLVCYFVILGTG